MPYTPPTQREATDSNRPVLRNANAYGSLENQGRPGLPRSRSATYISKHRRVPQIAEEQLDAKSPSPVVSSVPSDDGEEQKSTTSQSIRLPSRTHDEALVVAPATSASNSKDEDRSVQLPVVPEASAESSEDDEDELLLRKLPLVRKKSGALVKPALRPARAPRPKSVHFGGDIAQVRHFLQVDRPLAVSAGSYPFEDDDSDSAFEDSSAVPHYKWEIHLTNFPTDTAERLAKPVRVERLWLSSDNKCCLGSVAVANLAFKKVVAARFTMDYWKTTSEVLAEYTAPTKDANDGHDRFAFSVRLSDQANLEAKTLYLCVRYNVNGQEFWDNNNGTNYQIDFVKKFVSQQPSAKSLPRAVRLRLYKYLPFSLPRAIRLLQLMPAAAGQSLQCRLVEASLDERPKYEALSYEWGRHARGAQNIRISCEGRSISITRNLEAALRVLRNESRPRTLWVDGICIDQQSLDEKNCQVPLMKEIFELASQVIVWLGSHGPESEETFRKIAMSGQDYLERFRKRFGDGKTDFGEVVIDFLSHMYQQTAIDTIMGPDLDPKLSHTLNELFNSQYFHRTWTIQELAFSSKAVVLWANRAVPWPTFWGAGQAYFEKASYDTLLRAHGFYIHGMAYGLTHWKALLDSSTFGGISQVEFLAMARSQKATDPRDKVFALQHILKLLGPIGFPESDYSKTAEDVYMAVAKALVVDTQFNLWGVLHHAVGRQRLESLPSWVPDWSDDTAIEWPNVALCSQTRFPLTTGAVSGEGSKLRVLGKIFSSVEKTTFGYQLPQGNTPAHYMQNKRAVGWMEVIKAVLESSGKNCDDFCKIIHSELVARYRDLEHISSNLKPVVQPSKDYETWYHSIERSSAILLKAIGIKEDVWDSLGPEETAQRLSWRALGASLGCAWTILEYGQERQFFSEVSLFTLRGGFLGASLGGVAVGDVIALLPGLDAPAILRPQEEFFQFVGLVYIFGAMDAKTWKTDSLVLEEVVII